MKTENYYARLYFVSKGNERSYTIRFKADGPVGAVHGTFRWANNRHKAFNDEGFFARLGYVEVGTEIFSEFDEDGYLPQALTTILYIWKENDCKKALPGVNLRSLGLEVPFCQDPLVGHMMKDSW